MPGQHVIDNKISYGLILTIILQIVVFTTFLVRIDSRVEVLEDDVHNNIDDVSAIKQFMGAGDRFTKTDGVLLEQRIEFYVSTINEIKDDLKEIKTEIKLINQ